jgi:hypothetical protein
MKLLKARTVPETCSQEKRGTQGIGLMPYIVSWIIALFADTVFLVSPARSQELVPPPPQPTDSTATAPSPPNTNTIGTGQLPWQPPNRERKELPEEGQQFIRSIALLLLPTDFDDEDGWGDEKRIQSGLNVGFEDGRLETSRRWKNVNHGTWLRGSGELVDPEKFFKIKVTQLPDPHDGTKRYEIVVSARLNVTGQQQQWNLGVMLWSISADAMADLTFRTTVDTTAGIVATDKGSMLRFQPTVKTASVHLAHFRLNRVSHVKGTIARQYGEVVEELIELRIKKENKSLAAKINKAIAKKQDDLQIPVDFGGWFNAAVPKMDSEETKARGKKDAASTPMPTSPPGLPDLTIPVPDDPSSD